MSKNHSPNFSGNDNPEIAELRERIAKMEALLQEIADTTLTRDELRSGTNDLWGRTSETQD